MNEKYNILLISTIALAASSCSMVKNKNTLITPPNSSWVSFSTNPQHKFYFANNNFIAVSVPELFEEVVTFGPLVFPVIPVFHNQYIKNPYNIHITTSVKGKDIEDRKSVV